MKKTFDFLFHRNGVVTVETTYCTDQQEQTQEQWINGNGERSLKTAKSRGDITLILNLDSRPTYHAVDLLLSIAIRECPAY